MKRVISFFLAITLVLAITATAFAQEVDITAGMDAYAKQMLEKYIKEVHPEVVNAYISNPISVYDVDDNTSHTVYFALSDTDVLGILSVSFYEGQYISSYAYNVSERINSAYKNQTSISLLVSEEKTCVKIGDTVYRAFGDGESVSITSLNTNGLTNTIILAGEPLNLISSRAMSTMFNSYLNVPYVENPEGYGYCWAACVAMNVNYFFSNLGYNLTASELVELYTSIYSVPLETDDMVLRYCNAYVIFGLYPSVSTSPLTAYQIYGNLYNNKPVQFGMLTIDDDGKVVGHAMIFNGVTAYIETTTSEVSAFYRIIDPNEDTGVVLYVGSDVVNNGSNLSFTSGGNFYFGWQTTVQF